MQQYQENIENIEGLKEMWKEINMRLGNLEEENKRLARRVMTSNYKSAKNRLISKYCGFIVLEGVMTVVMFLFFYFNPELNESYRLPALIYWTLFFLGEVIVDTYLMLKVRSMDIYNSSIQEISETAAANWRIHKIAIIIGLPVAIGAAILFALAADANQYVIGGMIVGGFIGLIIGWYQLMKFMKYYHLLQSPD